MPNNKLVVSIGVGSRPFNTQKQWRDNSHYHDSHYLYNALRDTVLKSIVRYNVERL
jgi:hypothetical protein